MKKKYSINSDFVPAKKSLGQNFLNNPRVLEKILKAAGLSKKDKVLEIGPGKGSLTKELLKHSGFVVAVEKDKRLISVLESSFKNSDNFKLIEGDILEIGFNSLGLKNRDFKVVANIPYYLTSHLLRKLLESEHQPNTIVLMVQKEVAKRILAQPPHMNLLAISVQYFGKAEICGLVSRNNFNPAPKVDSAIIKIVLKKNFEDGDKKFFNIVRVGFSEKRKLLINNLSKHLEISKEIISKYFKEIKIPLNSRAENLKIEDWQKLFSILKSTGSNH